MERFIRASQVLLQRHYSEEEALDRAKTIADRWRDDLGEVHVISLMQVAMSMSLSDEAWWDSSDASVRALGQLQEDTLVLESLDAFVSDIEEGLGRPIGSNEEEQVEALNLRRWHMVAELKGEDPPADVHPLAALFESLGIDPQVVEAEVPSLVEEEGN